MGISLFGGGFGIIFTIMFVIILGVFVVAFVRGIGQWSKNNASPRLTVDATVVAKRAQVSHDTHHDTGTGAAHHHSSTSYYATFQVESGDRMELHVRSIEYGMLVEGDFGKLTFQGTRYLGFERQR